MISALRVLREPGRKGAAPERATALRLRLSLMKIRAQFKTFSPQKSG